MGAGNVVGLFSLQFLAELFGLQFLYGVLQFCFSAFLECIRAGMLKIVPPMRDYPGYNSK